MHNITKGYGVVSVSLFFVISAILLTFATVTASQAAAGLPDEYTESLVESARNKKLWEERYWWILLHYKKETVGGVRSIIDDPAFFLADDGDRNPQAELEALIRTYFRRDVPEEVPDVCNFIGRYTWVKEMLSPDADRVEDLHCESVDAIKAKTAYLIFPTYYLNNPASMFGHTFINIETDYSNKLLTNAVNYAAYAGDANAVQYVLYGIFGKFRGYYSILPYYKKITEYSDIDQRDIWEYRLNLTDSELRKMVMHIRELENIYSDYYFFSENCSYHLLYLLEVARPSLHLTDQFGLWVVPIDTVKLMKQQGLIDDIEFRPSNGTKIRQKLSLLSGQEKAVAFDVASGKTDPAVIQDMEIPRDRKIIAHDLVSEYTKYRLVKKEINQKEYQGVILKNLRSRSRLGTFDAEQYNVATPVDPSDGHDTSRISFAAGETDDRFFLEADYYPSFTDLLSTEYTSREGMQIVFLNTRVRYYTSDKKVRLERADLLDIISLTPRSRFFKSLSWKFSTGFRRKRMPDGSRKMVYRLNSGTGVSYDAGIAGLFYILPELELNVSGHFEKDAAVGAGVMAGLMKEIVPRWKVLLNAEAIHFEPDDDFDETRLSLEQSFMVNRNNRITMSVSREENFDDSWYEGNIAWQRFF